MWACWPYEPAIGRGNAGRFTYSASLSYKTPWGLVPYVTSAKSSAIEIGQAGQVLTSLLAARDWLSNSFLNEVGVKFTALDDHLLGSLDWYVQNRTQLNQGARHHQRDRHAAPRAPKLELRYVATPNLSLTLAAVLQHTTIKGPDHSFAYVPARTYGVSAAERLWRQLYRVRFFHPAGARRRLRKHAVAPCGDQPLCHLDQRSRRPGALTI